MESCPKGKNLRTGLWKEAGHGKPGGGRKDLRRCGGWGEIWGKRWRETDILAGCVVLKYCLHRVYHKPYYTIVKQSNWNIETCRAETVPLLSEQGSSERWLPSLMRAVAHKCLAAKTQSVFSIKCQFNTDLLLYFGPGSLLPEVTFLLDLGLDPFRIFLSPLAMLKLWFSTDKCSRLWIFPVRPLCVLLGFTRFLCVLMSL